MKKGEENKNRRSIRLKGYDYSQPGAYFVTVCTKNREFLFGEVMEGDMALSENGCIVVECWGWLASQYPQLALDEWVVMPNHTHCIVVLSRGGGSRTAPKICEGKDKSLGRLVGAFKTVSTKRINKVRDTPGLQIWQRNYYEHIIRDEEELARVRQYIRDNPLKWEFDRENPNRRGPDIPGPELMM